MSDLKGTFKGKHVLTVKQFNREQCDYIFEVAASMKKKMEAGEVIDALKGKLLALMFYEPSTRTMSSFQAAMLRLGGSVLPIAGTKNTSVAKGETLEDTVRCLESYTDAIVLRHPEIGSAARAAKVLDVPLLNAGDGAGEHPTQALLDSFTMITELGALDGLTITMLGDLKHGRTVHSLAQLLTHYKVKLNYVSPDSLKMPGYIKDAVSANGIEQKEYSDLSEVLASTDVLYVTRVQKERFASVEEYKKVANAYVITPELLEEYKAKDTLRVLHPLPRVGEIDPRLDSDKRAAYFRQMKYGMYTRMALLALALGVEDQC